jgi:hypothetical protein
MKKYYEMTEREKLLFMFLDSALSFEYRSRYYRTNRKTLVQALLKEGIIVEVSKKSKEVIFELTAKGREIANNELKGGHEA